ncbi:MAG: hypothetical protein AAFY73_05505 [Pseudomonadota bacterium]
MSEATSQQADPPKAAMPEPSEKVEQVGPASATPAMPRFPSLERLSNDNRREGLASLPMASVGFEGAFSHYRLALLALLGCVAAAAFLVFDRGFEAVAGDTRLATFTLAAAAGVVVLFLWGEMRRRTVGVWAVGDEIRLSKGLPSFKLHEFKLSEVGDISVKRSAFGSSGTVVLRTVAGKRHTVRGVERAADASAYLPLWLAAGRSRQSAKSRWVDERNARVAATTPYVVALPRPK